MSMDKSSIRQVLISKLQHDDFVLENFEMKLLPVTGLMGQYFELVCDIQDRCNNQSRTYKFFVKKTGNVEEHREILVKCFKKEKATYELFNAIAETFPGYGTFLPKCFYMDEHHLVLENLAAEQYVLQVPQRVATDEELLAVLDSLAAMHAGAIAFEEHHRRQNINASSDNVKEYALNEAFPSAFVELYLQGEDLSTRFFAAIIRGMKTAIRVLDMPETLSNGKKFEDEIDRFWALLDDDYRPFAKFRCTVCHNDLCPTNIFIKYDSAAGHAKIVDHQVARFLPPASDVLLYICINTTRAYRKEHLLRLKRVYFDHFVEYLSKHGVEPETIYTWEEFLASFNSIELLARFLVMSIFTLVYQDQYVEYSEEKAYALFVDRSPLITAALRNEYYKGRLQEAVRDILEYYENN